MRTVKLAIEISEPVQRLLAKLVRTGFYGGSEEEAAERLICQVLDQRERDTIKDPDEDDRTWRDDG